MIIFCSLCERNFFCNNCCVVNILVKFHTKWWHLKDKLQISLSQSSFLCIQRRPKLCVCFLVHHFYICGETYFPLKQTPLRQPLVCATGGVGLFYDPQYNKWQAGFIMLFRVCMFSTKSTLSCNFSVYN